MGRTAMTITKGKISRAFTEADLLALAVRFEIRGSLGKRQYFVDGVEVNEQAYNRAFLRATKAEAAGKKMAAYPRRSRR